MKILVIGGLGYLGSRICNYLFEKKLKITLSSRRKTKEIVIENKKFININIKWNKKFINQLVKQYDSIIFVAGYNSKDSVSKYKECMKFSRESITMLCDAMINSQIKNFIYFSSAHVYKSNLLGKINEKSLTTNDHPYSLSKLLSEKILIKKLKNSHINLKILRLSNAVGYPLFKNNKVWNLFVNDVIKQAVLNKKVIIKSNPLTQRDFISISEVCRFTYYLLKNENFLKNKNILNLGSNKSLSLKQMTKKIQVIAIKNQIYFDIMFLNSDNLSNKSFELEYQSKYLHLSKFHIKKNLNKEIDLTIKKTKKWYKKK